MPERASPLRTVFQRDRDRIIHSAAFRRLALKTQVFFPEAGDDHRTRLTHSIEVAQIARTIARALGLDEDLTEALALAHDLGHPPFGHTGEAALDACVKDAGGFDHNAQTLRVVLTLERRYPDFNGLNLTWETLEGLLKRKGPPADPSAPTRDLAGRLNIDLTTFAGGEAQAAAVADDIAYNAHDLEDGLAAGLFTCRDLEAIPFVRGVLAAVAADHPRLDARATVRELTRRMVGWFVEDVVAESRRRLAASAPRDAWALRGMDRGAVALSDPFVAHSRDVKAFLRLRMYQHPRITETRSRAALVVRDLAGLFIDAPQHMPPDDAERASAAADRHDRMRAVADCVAGMTDRGALLEHRRCFGTTPDLR